MSNYRICHQRNCELYIDHPRVFASATTLHHGDNADIFHKFNRYWQIVRKAI